MKNKDYIISKLKLFRDDYAKWDTEEFSQADMIEDLNEIIKLVEKNL